MRKSLKRIALAGLIAVGSFLPLNAFASPQKESIDIEGTPIIVESDIRKPQKELSDLVITPEKPKFHLNRESSISISNTLMPNYQEINPSFLFESIETEPGVYETKAIGLRFNPSNPKPLWFSSDTEIDKISSIIKRIPSWNNSLENIMSKLEENSFHGQIWALSNLMSLLYAYNYDSNRNYEELITETQLFGALKKSYSTGKHISIGNCADFSYFLTKAGEKIGLDICEINAASSNNRGGHAISLTYNKDCGYVAIDGPYITFTNTHNRELAEKIYQKQSNFTKFTTEIFSGDDGAQLLELTDEGKLLAQAWEYEESPKNFKEELLHPGKKDILTGINIQEGTQYSFVKFQVGNLFFKQGYLQGDELSTLGKSDFALIGLELSGQITDIKFLDKFFKTYGNLKTAIELIGIDTNFKYVEGFANLNMESRTYLDDIISSKFSLKRNTKITDTYSITPKISVEYLCGGLPYLFNTLDKETFEKFIQYPISTRDIYFGIADELKANDALKLNNYFTWQFKTNSKTYNQQAPPILIPYSFHIGQRWNYQDKRKSLTLNPEFFIAKPELGVSLELSAESKRASASINTSYSRSRIQPFNPDKIGLNVNLSINSDKDLEFYFQGEYTKEFWPVTPVRNYSLSMGVKTQVAN